jgi:hypothetical protein
MNVKSKNPIACNGKLREQVTMLNYGRLLLTAFMKKSEATANDAIIAFSPNAKRYLSKMFYPIAVTAVFACMMFFASSDAKAQPFLVDKATYVNIDSNEIPAQESLMVLDFENLFWKQRILNKRQTYCTSNYLPEGDDPNCDISDQNNWGPWHLAVYKFKEPNMGCEVRVEYQYRNCSCDGNRTQHDIIAVIYETTWLPCWFPFVNCKCNDLHDWLNSGNEREKQEKYISFLDDIYVKLAEQAFIDADNDCFERTGKRIYCDDPVNKPVKTHHTNGSCESMCVSTYHFGEQTYDVISRRPCTSASCCVIEDYVCRDSATGKIQTTSNYSSGTQQSQAGCTAMGYLDGFPCSGGETNFTFPCEFSCDYTLRNTWCLTADYPFRDLYADNVYVGEPLVKTSMPGIEGVFSVNPNPASDLLNIEFTSDIKNVKSISITDNNGKTLLNTTNGSIKIAEQINISTLTNGNYFIIVDIDGVEYSTKFIIAK